MLHRSISYYRIKAVLKQMRAVGIIRNNISSNLSIQRGLQKGVWKLFFDVIVCIPNFKPFQTRRSHDCASHVFDRNSPAARAKKLFKPYTINIRSIVVSIKKTGKWIFLWVTS